MGSFSASSAHLFLRSHLRKGAMSLRIVRGGARAGTRSLLLLSLVVCASLLLWDDRQQAVGFLGADPTKRSDQEQPPKPEGEKPSGPTISEGGLPAQKPSDDLQTTVDADGNEIVYEEYDWTAEAYERQLSRIAERKRRAKGIYTDELKQKKIAKAAMWQAATRKSGAEGVTAVRAEGMVVEIKVLLEKPLGIEFRELEGGSGRVWVGDIQPGASAASNGEIASGDWLGAVNGVKVDDAPFEEALDLIRQAEGEIQLVFKRQL
eukprot:TRINITY_DN1111_c0_g1_i2.p1 TRINITY_DN1111_c0_g1~~TRINITY_DN1111_c0_g1_i2.p1  ORF type:complete len:263 (-),score=56.89 TRINITY_DN1111_c0_g1_i2:66-854(-)